jgi:hypothetical protein
MGFRMKVSTRCWEVGFRHLNLCGLLGLIEIYNVLLGRSHPDSEEGGIDAGSGLLLEAAEQVTAYNAGPSVT